MASGCIMGECQECESLIWEDESFKYTDDDGLVHLDCVNKVEKYFLFKDLELRNKEIERLKELRTLIENILGEYGVKLDR